MSEKNKKMSERVIVEKKTIKRPTLMQVLKFEGYTLSLMPGKYFTTEQPTDREYNVVYRNTSLGSIEICLSLVNSFNISNLDLLKSNSSISFLVFLTSAIYRLISLSDKSI